MELFLIMLLNNVMNIRQPKIFSLVNEPFHTQRINSLLFLFLAEEREELQVLNNFRQQQLELKHRQLLQELEILKTARQTSNFISMETLSLGDQSSLIDSNFKNLM